MIDEPFDREVALVGKTAIKRHLALHRKPVPQTRLVSLTAAALALRVLDSVGITVGDLKRRTLLLDDQLSSRTGWPGLDIPRFLTPVPPFTAAGSGRVGPDVQQFVKVFEKGFIIRDLDDVAGRLGAIAEEGSLRIECELGEVGALITCDGDECSVLLPGRLPATVFAALEGMRVCDIVGHPFFKSCASCVTSAVREEPGDWLRLKFRDEAVVIDARVRTLRRFEGP